jgi:hypothetical protein
LKQCCGIDGSNTREFGMHSLRSGGDTHLFKQGFSQEMRMDIGVWATNLVERGYLRQKIAEKLDMCKACGM